jgi:hypothetical protein
MRLDLKHHCIETAAKQERRRVVSALLELDESSERFSQFAEDLELVTAFLENSDFRALRSNRPELAGGRDILVELTRGEDPGQFVLIVVTGPGADTE